MKILNTTKRTVLAKESEIAESGLSKARGLMFRKELPEGKALVMVFGKEGNPSIWMPFMRFSIDVIFLSSEKRVVGIHENVKPMGLHPKSWKVYYPEKPAKYIIETNAGEVKRSLTEPGHRIEF
jgi:uncharacterized membrane protein (UPF0127 family)